MSWGKVDDQFFHNGKIIQTSLAARGLWVTALSWTCANRKEVIPAGVPSFLAMGDADDLCAELVAVGLWHAPGHDCDRCPAIDDGWVVHDWPQYQEKTTSEKRAEAGAKGGRAGTGDSKRRAPAKQDASKPQATVQAKPKQERKQVSRPVPTRPSTEPDGSGGKTADTADDTDTAEGKTAQALVAHFVDLHAKRPPGQVVGQVAKHVGALLAEGFTSAEIRLGLQALRDKSLHPSTLPSLVNEALNQPKARGRPAHAASDPGNDHRHDPAFWTRRKPA